MKKYYDKINRKQTFEFRNKEETIICVDDRVKCFWEQLGQGEEIEFNDSNLPIKVRYELDENGNRYSHYLPLEDGVYRADLVKIQDGIDAKIQQDVKQVKQDKLDTLVVESNTVPFDADNQSINYMSAVVGLASFKMLQTLLDVYPDMKPYYEATFKSKVDWRNANNSVSEVQLETVAEALEQAMLEVGNVKTK